MRRQNARARKGALGLTPSLLRAVVISLFRRRNDYGNFDVSEVICQLRQFGVTDVRGLRLLMKKHRRSILADENRKMARAETLHLLDTFYPEGIDVHSNTSWFAVTGLAREAMGGEFGWWDVYSESCQDPRSFPSEAKPQD